MQYLFHLLISFLNAFFGRIARDILPSNDEDGVARMVLRLLEGEAP